MRVIAKSKLKLLKVFYGDTKKRLYMQELGRLIGKKPGVFQRTLQGLVDEGILTSERQGNLRYFRANIHHPLYGELRKVVLKAQDAFEALTAIVASISSLELAFIYGSYAKEKIRATSDIDVLIVGKPNAEVQFVDALPALERSLGREINHKFYTPHEYKQKLAKNDAFLKEILSGTILWLKKASHAS